MNVEQSEWNKLLGDVGYIRAKVDVIGDLPERVASVETETKNNHDDIAFLKGKGARRMTIGVALVSAAGAVTSGAAAAVAIFLR